MNTHLVKLTFYFYHLIDLKSTKHLQIVLEWNQILRDWRKRPPLETSIETLIHLKQHQSRSRLLQPA